MLSYFVYMLFGGNSGQTGVCGYGVLMSVYAQYTITQCVDTLKNHLDVRFKLSCPFDCYARNYSTRKQDNFDIYFTQIGLVAKFTTKLSI